MPHAWYKSVIQLGFGLYGIHNLVPAALGRVYPVETSTSLYNLYLEQSEKTVRNRYLQASFFHFEQLPEAVHDSIYLHTKFGSSTLLSSFYISKVRKWSYRDDVWNPQFSDANFVNL